jgi:flagellar biogenesis protein FliO
MSQIQWIKIIAALIIAGIAIPCAAQASGQASSLEGHPAVSATALAKGDPDLSKPPEVVVDISGLSELQSAPRGSVLPNPLSEQTKAASGTKPFADPLSFSIDEAAEPRASLIDTSQIQRWLRQPLGAAAFSLGIVFCGYFFVRVLTSSGRGRQRPGRLPRNVVELVGFVPLGARQQLQLVRLGSKLVLVAISANRTEPLAEVTDPVEVDQILAACQSGPSALAGAISRWTGRQSAREFGRSEMRRARAVFEA